MIDFITLVVSDDGIVFVHIGVPRVRVVVLYNWFAVFPFTIRARWGTKYQLVDHDSDLGREVQETKGSSGSALEEDSAKLALPAVSILLDSLLY